MDSALSKLQQIGEGAVHNVAYKISKVLKYKIPLTDISPCNHISNCTTYFGRICGHYKVLFLQKYCFPLSMSTLK